ncbi:response regulator [Piscinibacter sp. XHJ-5]|uniref:response regulator n=1 Tax=Piscinibacter sp. XHJ-5 TaxID=3037797 RepID=UPI00245317ED|nr:response regulator [Piscinibacter sp. XHJ-5]
MDFAEFFTHSARELVPLAWQKELLFLFDYRGPLIDLDADRTAMHGGLQRLSLATLGLLKDGFIFICAQTDLREHGMADVSVSIAGTGERADDQRVGEVLRRLDLRERPHAADLAGSAADAQARVAAGRCPITGATVSFAANRTDGLLFAFDISVPAREIDPGASLPNAQRARAWLISETPAAYQSLVRRLQRLGWATTSFSSVPQMLDQLDRMSSAMARPLLVIATESPGLGDVDLQPVRQRLPHAQLVLAGTFGSARRGASDIDFRLWPFSPAELHEFTRRACDEIDTLSGETVPAPISFSDRPHALVVDDNAVNLLVASGLLQMAGFEVTTASGGAEAVQRCRERAPQLVLMDVHMPGMDGLEATRVLRQLQRDGALAPFPIVAATADSMAIGERACFDAGMDGYLCKPLTLEAIHREVTRVMPAAPATVAQP